MAVRRKILLALGLAAGVCGCTVGPDYQPPEIAVPALFGGQPRQTVSQEQAPDPGVIRWWQTLHDPELNRLVERAVACNPDIEIALTRMQAVRTQQIVVIGSALPQVEASGGTAAGTGNDLTKGRVAQALRAGSNNQGLQNINAIGGFDMGWELDLWGRYRRQLEAVRADAQSFFDLRNGVIISVIADTARNYINLRGLQLRLRITRDAVKTAQRTADLAEARYKQGITNELDVTLAKRELANVKARIPELIGAIAHAESRLALLLGSFSGDITRELEASASRGLPRVPSRLRAGVPAELLRRRPDIRQAERQLAAATARIGVMTANLFPSVMFTAGIGDQNGERASGKTSPIGGPIWSAGPGGYWPLLDFGRLDALIDIQELQAHEALVNYKRSIIFAVEETGDAIKQFRALQQRLRELSVALEQSHRSLALATDRYKNGITDFLNVLDAQRQEFGIEDQNAVAQEAVVIQYIALYKALGGGWELYDVLPPIRDVQPAIIAAARRLTNDWH
jgi:NodT family efflux transporter outer membrane factor (OMF) lipoprotein